MKKKVTVEVEKGDRSERLSGRGQKFAGTAKSGQINGISERMNKVG